MYFHIYVYLKKKTHHALWIKMQAEQSWRLQEVCNICSGLFVQMWFTVPVWELRPVKLDDNNKIIRYLHRTQGVKNKK